MLELSQLQTVVAVAECGSFSRAAERLNVTQSAISQSVKSLETRLQVQIFKRAGKNISLTSEGDKIYLLAHEFMKKMDQTLEEISHAKDSLSGKIRIGTLTGVGKSWIAPELMKFAIHYPEVCVVIKLSFYEELVKNFEEGLLDILILPENCLPNLGKKEFFSEEKATLVFPRNGKFHIHSEISFQELTSMPTILFEPEDPLYTKWCLEHFRQRPQQINVRYVINAHGHILQAVSEGLGIAVVPLHVLNRSYFKDKVDFLGEKFEISNFSFYIVYHEDSLQLARIREVLNLFKQLNNPLIAGN